MSAVAAQLVAQFIEPDPIVYTRLAAVNRAFYQTFTGDEYWWPLDVYDKKTNIFRHFIESPDLNVVKWFWRPLEPCTKNLDATDNKYAHLGAAVNKLRSSKSFSNKSTDDDLLPSIIRAGIPELSGVADFRGDDGQLIFKGKYLHKYWHSTAQGIKNVNFWRQLIDSKSWDFYFHPLQHAPEEVRVNKEIVELAVSQCLESVLYSTPEIIESYGFSRDEILTLIEGRMALVLNLPEKYQNDKEVVLRALKLRDEFDLAEAYLQSHPDAEICDYGIMLDACGKTLCYEKLGSVRDDPEVCEALVKSSNHNLFHIHRSKIDDRVAGEAGRKLFISLDGTINDLHEQEHFFNPEFFAAFVSSLKPSKHKVYKESVDQIHGMVDVFLDDFEVHENHEDEIEYDKEFYDDGPQNRPLFCIYNKSFMRDQIKRDPNAFNFACEELREDPEFFELALHHPSEEFDLAVDLPEWIEDKEDLLKVWTFKPELVAKQLAEHIDDPEGDDRTLILEYMEKGLFKKLPEEIKEDYQLALWALEDDPKNFDVEMIEQGDCFESILEMHLNDLEDWRLIEEEFFDDNWELVAHVLLLKDEWPAFEHLLHLAINPKYYEDNKLPGVLKNNIEFTAAAVKLNKAVYDVLPLDHARDARVKVALGEPKVESIKEFESKCEGEGWTTVDLD